MQYDKTNLIERLNLLAEQINMLEACGRGSETIELRERHKALEQKIKGKA